MQMNGDKVLMWAENDVGGDLWLLTLFGVTHPGLADVKVDMVWQQTSHPNITEIETEWKRERERLFKPFN